MMVYRQAGPGSEGMEFRRPVTNVPYTSRSETAGSSPSTGTSAITYQIRGAFVNLDARSKFVHCSE
jgi:hypothetical protein